MKRTGLIVLIVAIIIGLAGIFVLATRPNNETSTNSPTRQDTSGTEQSQPAPEPSPDNQNTNNSESPVATSQVEIKDMAFQPANITVKSGTTVTWTNKDNVMHDVRPNQESDAFRGSQLLAKDESYSFTFTTPGTYSYHCSPHPHMTGTVTVAE